MLHLEHQFEADWIVVGLRKNRIAIVLSALLLLGLGCNSNRSGSGNAAIPIPINPVENVSLKVNPKALVVTAGGAASNVTANLTGSSSAIAWSLSGPGTISSTIGDTTSYTPPASVTAATAATLTATSGSASGQAMITINPSPGPIITVAGQILDVAGTPVA